MARSAGGSTGAASLTTLDATTSEGDTHLSPMMMRGDEPRFDDDARRASPERSTRAARLSGSVIGMGGGARRGGGAARGTRDATTGRGGETTTGTTTRTTTRTSNGARETRMKTAEMRYECPRSTRRR